MQTEIWKNIVGYEGLYQVSNLGNIMRVSWGQWSNNGRVLSPVWLKGYHRVSLSKNWVMKKYLVHRLVALAFLPNPESKSDVNHIDGARNNNSLSNLDWCTSSENKVHSIEVLGSWIKWVIQYDLKWNEIERFTSIKWASIATGVHGSNIWSACQGRSKTAGWFRWKYS
jgi:hypothetical protein